jgi:hypothetical protein
LGLLPHSRTKQPTLKHERFTADVEKLENGANQPLPAIDANGVIYGSSEFVNGGNRFR